MKSLISREELKLLPDDFEWGAATSAYQVEGNFTADGRSPCIWDAYCATPGKIKNADLADPGCDHYNLWKSDVDLMKKMQLSTYRFSVSWPRILPDGVGRINQKGLDFYDRLIDRLCENDIKPTCTLYHWDLPLILAEKGGWINRDIVDWFGEFTEVYLKQVGDRISYFSPINEMLNVVYNGYLWGTGAPGFRHRPFVNAALHHVLMAHGRSIEIAREVAPEAKLGCVINQVPISAGDNTSETKSASHMHDILLNRAFLDPLFKGEYPKEYLEVFDKSEYPLILPEDFKLIHQPMDFVGVNFYSDRTEIYDEQVSHYPHTRRINVAPKQTSMGWDVVPTKFTEWLVHLKDHYKIDNIMVTENGSAWVDQLTSNLRVHDVERTEYLSIHLRGMIEAIKQGVNISGYYVWSFMDNFEWDQGFEKRFGMVYIDYESKTRIIKDSGYAYTDTIRTFQSLK